MKDQKPLLCYQSAKRACELFESEYMGQDQKELWKWAVETSTKEREK